MKAKRTFRSYLIFWYSMVSGLTLVIFSVIIYILISGYLESAIDATLAHLANVEAGGAFELDVGKIANPEETPHIHETPLDNSIKENHKTHGRFVTIYTKNGIKLDSYSSNNTVEMPVNRDVIKNLGFGNLYYETVLLAGKPFRILYLPIIQKMEITHIVQVGVYMTNTVVVENKLKSTLLILNLILMGISLLISYFMANKAVLPIIQISRTAEEINSSTLKKRVEVVSPFKEIRQLTSLFNAMLERIDKAFQSQKDFIANASHEIQSPLTIIKGTTEVILRKKRSEPEYVYTLKSVLEETNRLYRLLNDLLTLATVDNKVDAMEMSRFNLSRLVADIVESKSFESEKKNIPIELIANKDVQISADIGMITQLINNLLDNAIKYTNIGGQIRVSSASRENYACLEVKDNGDGIPEPDLPKIFDRFYRVDKSRSRNTGGTGLGLSIVKEIAEFHKGWVFVDSEVGKGTTFIFKVPVG